MPEQFLSVSLGELISAASFAGTVVWAHFQMKARVDTVLESIERHESRLNKLDDRVNEHGEAIAGLHGRRRGDQ
jgi:hypothetical protein